MESERSAVESVETTAREAGRYFRHMAQFVGFREEDGAAIKQSQLVIEKYIPEIVGKFYDHLLHYPPTRRYFLKKDGSIDQDYLRLRMVHLTNFWRRTASGEYDDEYARFLDKVGLAHTSRGADPKVYIPERYVIGQLGFVQHAIGEALRKELHELDPELEARATRAWNLLLMVILEMLSRAYSEEHDVEASETIASVNTAEVRQLAVDTYERGLGLYRAVEFEQVLVAEAADIPEGERLIAQVGDQSVGVFHHGGHWYALRNHCLHRGGPVATGSLEGDILTCPWHGYQYDVTTGKFLLDPGVGLETYPVLVTEGKVHLQIPEITMGPEPLPVGMQSEADTGRTALASNQFFLRDLRPGKVMLVQVGGQRVAVYNVGGTFYATQHDCTHEDGPLSEGDLQGTVITCPWHGSRFDVTTGKLVRGPAQRPLQTFRVSIEGET
ncbi:MAG: Rieske 2Fe-2S domain-containing protein, partial [Anaerolineales bacterium]